MKHTRGESQTSVTTACSGAGHASAASESCPPTPGHSRIPSSSSATPVAGPGHLRIPSTASDSHAASGHKRTSSTRSTASTAASTCGVDVIAVVDKFAFNVEINVDPCTLKRFTNGAACVKWLGKRLNPQRPYDGEAIVLVVKSPELEVISKFLDEFAGVSLLVPKVVVYGAEEIDLAEADSSNTLEEAIVKANALITSRAPTASVPVANASQTCTIYDVDGLVWIGEEAPFGCEGTPGRRGFASAQKAISWLERQMKLCHHPCAACTPKRRCPTCNRAYKSKAVSKQPPWVGDKLQALVVAHHADALETYLSLFPQNCGP